MRSLKQKALQLLHCLFDRPRYKSFGPVDDMCDFRHTIKRLAGAIGHNAIVGPRVLVKDQSFRVVVKPVLGRCCGVVPCGVNNQLVPSLCTGLFFILPPIRLRAQIQPAAFPVQRAVFSVHTVPGDNTSSTSHARYAFDQDDSRRVF